MRISDWSSDVCSSDLHALQRRDGSVVEVRATCAVVTQPDGRRYRVASMLPTEETQAAETVAAAAAPRDVEAVTQIGSASGGERVWPHVSISVVAVSLQKKQIQPTQHRLLLVTL